MIRLWGGAAVARDAFYDACDEAGVMARHLNSSPMFCSRVRESGSAWHMHCSLPSDDITNWERMLTPKQLRSTPRP